MRVKFGLRCGDLGKTQYSSIMELPDDISEDALTEQAAAYGRALSGCVCWWVKVDENGKEIMSREEPMEAYNQSNPDSETKLMEAVTEEIQSFGRLSEQEQQKVLRELLTEHDSKSPGLPEVPDELGYLMRNTLRPATIHPETIQVCRKCEDVERPISIRFGQQPFIDISEDQANKLVQDLHIALQLLAGKNLSSSKVGHE